MAGLQERTWQAINKGDKPKIKGRFTMVKYYRLIGEKRGFADARPIVVDEDMEKHEADKLLEVIRADHPLWRFWIEEQEYNDVQQSVRSESELSV